MRKFVNRMNSDANYRLSWSAKLSILFAWLIPLSGWNLLLLLWLWNTFCLYRENAHTRIRFFYIVVMVSICTLVFFNIGMRIGALLNMVGIGNHIQAFYIQ